MKKFTAIACLLIATLPSVRALDLTPHEVIQSNEGPPMKRYYFEADSKRLSFRIDGKMSLSGNSDTVGFGFGDLKNATMKISRSQTNPSIPFDEKNIHFYRNTARTFLAADATNVQAEEEKPNAISINGWTSHQFVYSYTFFGLSYRRSITFLNYSDTEQFIVDVTATADDYEKTYTRGYRVLNSLTDLPINTAGPT
jgi:hypothetical protein